MSFVSISRPGGAGGADAAQGDGVGLSVTDPLSIAFITPEAKQATMNVDPQGSPILSSAPLPSAAGTVQVDGLGAAATASLSISAVPEMTVT